MNFYKNLILFILFFSITCYLVNNAMYNLAIFPYFGAIWYFEKIFEEDK